MAFVKQKSEQKVRINNRAGIFDVLNKTIKKHCFLKRKK